MGTGIQKAGPSGKRGRSLPRHDKNGERRQTSATEALYSLRAEVSCLEAGVNTNQLEKCVAELTAAKEAETRATAARENELVTAGRHSQHDPTPAENKTNPNRDANYSRDANCSHSASRLRSANFSRPTNSTRGADCARDADCPRHSRDSTPVVGGAADINKSRLSDTQSDLPAAANQNPLMRRFCQTPCVNALDEYQTEESK